MRLWVKRIVLVLTSVLITFCLLEIVLHLMHKPDLQYDMLGIPIDLDRQVLYRLKPHCRFDINALGFRDHEFRREKPAKTKRILMLGDSMVMGLNLPAEETVPKMLESDLGPGYEVLNMGTYGYGPDQEFVRFVGDGLNLNPDLVILTLFPNNDFNDLFKNQIFHVDPNGNLEYNETNVVTSVLPSSNLWLMMRKALKGAYLDPKIELNLFIKLFRDLYDFDLARDPSSDVSRGKILLMEAIVQEMKRELDSRRIPFGIVILPCWESIEDHADLENHGISPGQYFKLEELADQVARSQGVKYLDLKDAFLKEKENGLFALRGHHLSLAGTRCAGSSIKPFVLSLLGKQDSSSK